MSTVVYPATALTGGTSECLDSFDGNDLNNGDIGMVTIPASRVYFYYLDATADLPESSPDVIRPDSNPGTKCWRLLVVQDMDLGADISGQYGVYNVLDYGAVGDGSTDDHEAIENTIRAANAAGGGIVWFPPLTFKCAGGIYPLEELNSITLKGAPGSLLYFDYTVDAWEESNFYLYGNDITIDSLHIDTSVTTRNEGHMGSCIVFPQGDHITVKNCYIANSAGAGIYIQAGTVSPYTVTNFDFSHNVIYNTFADGILIADGASHGTISNNLIHTTGDDGISISWNALNTNSGVYNYPQHIVVSNNKVYYAGTTESTSVGKGLNVNHSVDILFTGNDIIASRGAGFGCYAWVYETESTNWTRSGDVITLTSGSFNMANRYVGGYLFASENGEAYPITANTTTTLTATGCSALTSGGAGFLVSAIRARDVRVMGNKFYYCGCISSHAEAALYDYFSTAYFANAEYCTFNHNTVYSPYYDGVLKLGGVNLGCVHSSGGGNGTTRMIEVAHNEFSNLSGRGIMSVSNNFMQHMFIKGNTFKTVAEETLYVYRATSTFYMKGDVVIDGNTQFYCAYSGGTYCMVVDGVNATSWIYCHRNGRVRTTKDYFFDNYTNIDVESGSSSISGPLSSTDNAIVRWDGITGSTLQDSAVSIDDSGIITINTATSSSTLICANTPGVGNSGLQILMNAPAGQYNHLVVYGTQAGSYGSVAAYYGTKSTAEGIVMLHNGSNGVIVTDEVDGDILIQPEGSTAMTITPVSVTVPSLLYTASASSASNIICVNTPGASDHSALQVILNAPAGYYNNLAVYGTQEGSYGSVGAYYAKKETPEGIVIYHNGTNGVLATDTTDGTILIKPEGTTSMTLAPGTVALANGGAINEFSSDGTMAGNSDSAVPTEKAVVTYVASVAGTGDVTGPGSSTDNAIVRWDGVDGSTVQNCGITVDDSNIMTWPSSATGCNLVANPTHAGGPAYFQIALNANAGQYNQLKVKGTTVGSYGSVAAYFSDGSTAEGIVLAHDGSNGLLLTDATDGTILVKPQGTLAMTIAPTSVTVPSLLYTTSASAESNLICTNTPGSSNSLLQVIMNAPSGYYNQLLVYGSEAGSYGSIGAYYGTKSTAEGIVMYHNGSNGVIDTDATDGTLLIKSQGTTSLTLAPGTVQCANGVAVNEFSSDGTMAGNSDSAVPTEKAVVTYVAAHAGAGDVVGPASATDNALVRFDTATGKLVQNSAVTLDSGSNISTLSVDNPTVTTNSFLKVVIDGASGNYSQLVVCGSVAGSYGSLAAYYSTGATPEGIVMYHNGSNGVIDTDTTDGTLLIKAEGTTSMTVAPGTLKLANGGAINEFSTDGTLGGNSDSAVPTEKAVKTYAQPLNSDLTAIAGLAKTDGNFIVGNGSAWVAESGSTARTSLGLGSIATQASNNVSISGGSVSGLSSLSVSGDITLTGNIEYSSSGLYFTRSSAGKVFIGPTGNLSIGGNLYLNGVSTNYLFVSGNKLYFYNGSTNKEVQFV